MIQQVILEKDKFGYQLSSNIGLYLDICSLQKKQEQDYLRNTLGGANKSPIDPRKVPPVPPVYDFLKVDPIYSDLLRAEQVQ